MYTTFHPFNFPYASQSIDFNVWAPYVLQSFYGKQNLTVQPDIIYTDFKKNGDKLLVLGGGPSSNQKLDLSRYSDIWSMNGCYKLNIKFDLVAVGAAVDIESIEFKKYCSDFNPQLAFEIHPAWQGKKLPTCGFFHTKIYGKIGVGVRLTNLGAALGFKEIDFIGFDGPAPILKGDHYFDPGKTDLPSYCTEENADQVHFDQYDFFWNYIRSLYPFTKFNSIDKENKYHKNLI